MADYIISYTGEQLNTAIGDVLAARNNGGIVSSNALLDLIYPIGSIYMSINNTSPSTLFGGTWTQIEDTFLLAAGTTYTGGSTGGEATHTLNVNEMPSHNHSFTGTAVNTDSKGGHTHTAQSAGSHRHMVSQSYDMGGASTPSSGGYLRFQTPTHSGATGTCGENYASLMWPAGAHTHTTDNQGAHTHSITAAGTIGSKGSGTAHNNMPPYLSVYVWKRIS